MSIHEINSYLMENGIYAEYITNFHKIENIVIVSIDGDWKHDHRWAEDLMRYLGYTEIGNKVTDENGSDCYSADHYFIKSAL